MTVEDALSQSRGQMKENHKAYLNASLASLMELLRFDRLFVRAEGVSVWDADGNEYLDCLGGFGALNTGHNHPRVIAALEKVKHMPNLLQATPGLLPAALGKNLAVITPGTLCRSFFGNSGAEAVEGALKLARAATGKTALVYCDGSFHGKTLGALSVTGREKYQKPFLPLLPECRKVPYGDLAALEYALKDGAAAAFITEPIQGEGGVVVPPPGYLKGARELCSRYGALLILDEIQTGLGRTGKMFACEHEGVVPDIMCLSKSLGGGIIPVGAYITTDAIWKKAYGGIDKATLHSSTFSGNVWASAAALAALEVIIDEDLSSRARENGEYLLKGLSRLKEKYPLIKDVRGRGLLIGIEFNQPGGIVSKASFGLLDKLSEEYMGSMVAGELLNKHRIITAYTLNNPNVIRLEPPLTVGRKHLDYLLNALEQTFASHKGFFGFAASSAKTVLSTLKKK